MAYDEPWTCVSPPHLDLVDDGTMLACSQRLKIMLFLGPLTPVVKNQLFLTG
jgi:hypothetical protein